MDDVTEEDNLPTVKECREFLAVINRGRVMIDLPELEFLEFDTAEPGSPDACLSAMNLFSHAYVRVMDYYVTADDVRADDRIRPLLASHANGWGIPPVIQCVTDAFDSCRTYNWPEAKMLPERLHALRERMVEAGVVAP